MLGVLNSKLKKDLSALTIQVPPMVLVQTVLVLEEISIVQLYLNSMLKHPIAIVEQDCVPTVQHWEVTFSVPKVTLLIATILFV